VSPDLQAGLDHKAPKHGEQSLALHNTALAPARGGMT